MYFVQELPPIVDQLRVQLSEKTKEFFASIPSTSLLVPSGTNALEAAAKSRAYFRLTDGMFALKHTGHSLLMYEEGDCFGPEPILAANSIAICSDFAVRVDCHSISDIMLHVSQSPANAKLWTEILSLTIQLNQVALVQSVKDSSDPVPSVKQFFPGDEIIVQNTKTTDIYTLIDGHAEVLVDGTTVGEVLPDEIFGALAAFSDMPRSATVRATKNCVVLSLPASDFLGLMSSRPATVTKLVRDMSRALVAANKSLIMKL